MSLNEFSMSIIAIACFQHAATIHNLDNNKSLGINESLVYTDEFLTIRVLFCEHFCVCCTYFDV